MTREIAYYPDYKSKKMKKLKEYSNISGIETTKDTYTIGDIGINNIWVRKVLKSVTILRTNGLDRGTE